MRMHTDSYWNRYRTPLGSNLLCLKKKNRRPETHSGTLWRMSESFLTLHQPITINNMGHNNNEGTKQKEKYTQGQWTTSGRTKTEITRDTKTINIEDSRHQTESPEQPRLGFSSHKPISCRFTATQWSRTRKKHKGEGYNCRGETNGQ